MKKKKPAANGEDDGQIIPTAREVVVYFTKASRWALMGCIDGWWEEGHSDMGDEVEETDPFTIALRGHGKPELLMTLFFHFICGLCFVS